MADKRYLIFVYEHYDHTGHGMNDLAISFDDIGDVEKFVRDIIEWGRKSWAQRAHTKHARMNPWRGPVWDEHGDEIDLEDNSIHVYDRTNGELVDIGLWTKPHTEEI